ncbi:MAG: glycosyltransferase family 2 protein [Roseiarcus sp.]
MRLRTLVEPSGARGVVGHVVDIDDFERQFVVELTIDGWPVSLARANLFDANLFAEGIGDGCYRFAFVLDEAMARSGGRVEVRLANSDFLLGDPVVVGPAPAGRTVEAGVEWGGGLVITGWIGGQANERAPLVRAIVDGQTVAERLADRWTQRQDAAAPARAFVLELPRRFADGRARRARIIDELGKELPGSPCAFIAFADGLERFLAERAETEAERPRGALYDALFPRAYPMRGFAAWRERFPTPAPELPRPPKVAVALLGGGDLQASVETLETPQGCEWTVTAFEGASAFDIPGSGLEDWCAEDAADVEFVVFAPAGTRFATGALARLVDALRRFPQASLAYGDLTFSASDGGEWPLAFTAFDYERMLEQGYAALCFAARRTVVEAAAERHAGDVFTLFLSALPKEKPASTGAVVHAPGFVAWLPALDLDAAADKLARAVEAHLEARGRPGRTRPAFSARLPAIRVTRNREAAKVTTVVATRDDPEKLAEFVAAFRNSVAPEHSSLIIVECGLASGVTEAALDGAEAEGVRVAHMSGAYAPERAFNIGASIATSDFLVFATADMTPSSMGWLEEMLSRAVETDVAAVTPTLMWPSGLIQQNGLVVGPNFSLARAFGDLGAGEYGYGEAIAVAHEVGAASALGMLAPRRAFNDFAGFDVTRFPLRFAAADYCLRARVAAGRIVATPHAQWTVDRLHATPEASVGEQGDRWRRELETFRTVWAEALAADPLYSQLLALSGAPFSALAWPPRPAAPRLNTAPKPREQPPGI